MEGSVADCGRNVGLAETADARPHVRETAHSPIGLRGFSYSPKDSIAQAWIVPDSYRSPTRFLRGRRRRWFSAARSLGGKRGCANPLAIHACAVAKCGRFCQASGRKPPPSQNRVTVFDSCRGGKRLRPVCGDREVSFIRRAWRPRHPRPSAASRGSPQFGMPSGRKTPCQVNAIRA